MYEKYLKRELIKFRGNEFNISTTSMDWITWRDMYIRGYREPRYSVPAIREGFEFGLQLPGKVVILHWVQGAYDETGTDRR